MSTGRSRGVVRLVMTTTLTAVLAGAVPAVAPAQTILDKLLAKALRPRDAKPQPTGAPASPASQGVATAAAGAGVAPIDDLDPQGAQGTIATPSAARAFPPPPRSGPLSLDVAGVRLGMPLAQVRAALASTYRCDAPGTGPSFAEAVEDEVARRRGRSTSRYGGSAVARLDCKGPSGEELRLLFLPTPAGPVVDNLSFGVGGARVDIPAVRRQVMAKFGPSTHGDIRAGCWATSQEDCPLSPPRGPKLLTSSLGDALSIDGTRGQRALDADAAAIGAAADRVAPRRSGAAL